MNHRFLIVSLVLTLAQLVGCGKQNCEESCSKDDDCYAGLSCIEKKCLPTECKQCGSTQTCNYSMAVGYTGSDGDTCGAGSCSSN